VTKKMSTIVCAAFVAVMFCNLAVAGGEMTFITEDYYPWNYVENGELKGLSVDLLRQMWKEMGEPDHTIQVLPWARGYATVLKFKNHMLFTVARTAERESLFKWIGPISVTRYKLFGLKQRRIRLEALEDARNYSIGTVRGDATENILSRSDFSRLMPAHKIELNVHMLYKGHVDLLVYDEKSIYHVIRSLNYDPDEVESIWGFESVEDYYGFHIDTPRVVIEKYQGALDRLEIVHREIRDRYMGK